MNRRRLRVAAAVAGLALAVTACSGVPSSSKPQVIGPGLGDNSLGPQPTNTPQANAEPREIVQEFLKANISEPLDPRGPHEFLTPDEQRKWSDRGVVILAGSIDDAQVGIAFNGTTHTVSVPVRGTQIGSIGPNGAYSAVRPASGGEGTQWNYTYGLDPVNSQFRIGDAPDGLVVYASEFAQAYRPVHLYFLDQSSETRLVPDIRYTALQSPQAIASWALDQLIEGPRPELTSAVKNEISLPPSARPSVSINGLQIRVEMPGSSHLDSDTKVRMAAQLMATLANQSPKMSMTITDGGVPVDIGNFQESFTRADFAKIPAPTVPGQQQHFFDQTPDPPAQWPLFYVDAQHRLVTGDGQPVGGPLGVPNRYDLNSVAITGARADPNYYVAASLGSGAQQTLWVGRTLTGLNKSTVPRGPLTRPSWQAGQQEVWVASGSTVYRVDYSDRVAQIVPTSLPAGARITALRLSPEGSRIAMIVDTQSGQSRPQSQLWIGSIVSVPNSDESGPGAGTARIDSVEPITPPSYRLTDVAWTDDSTLWVVGSGPQGNGVWSVYADGAVLKDQPVTGLPQPQQLDSITAGVGVLPWVSGSGYVYQQNPDTQSWDGPKRHTTRGTKPVYQESYLD